MLTALGKVLEMKKGTKFILSNIMPQFLCLQEMSASVRPPQIATDIQLTPFSTVSLTCISTASQVMVKSHEDCQKPLEAAGQIQKHNATYVGCALVE